MKVTKIPKFRRFVLQNFPFIEQDFDALTDYALICKVVEYLNKVISQTNANTEQVAELSEEFNNLENYVEHYFDNLDVQTEINNKLDSMVEDGTLKSIINNEIFADLNSKVLQNTVDISANTEALEDKISEGQADSISMSMLTQEVREALTGGSTAVVAEDTVGTVNIKDGAVTILKLDDYLQATKIKSASTIKDLGVASGGIARKNAGTGKVEIGSPTSTDYSWYKVALTKGKYYDFTGYTYGPVGIIIADSEDNVIFWSNEDWSGYNLAPYSLFFRANASGLYAYIDIKTSYYQTSYKSVLRINTPTLREVDTIYNTLKKYEAKLLKTVDDGFLSISHVTGSDDTLPVFTDFSGSFTIDTKIYEMCKGVTYHVTSTNWSYVCGLYILALDNTIIYQSSTESTGDNYITVDYTFTAAQDGYIAVPVIGGRVPTVEVVYPFGESSSSSDDEITFSKWYALGDSLTEVNFRASTNYVGYITEELGITTSNLGISGAGYKKASGGGNTITSEIASILNYNYNTDIITVMGSINDFEYIANDLGELGDTTTDTLYGAMYVFFNTLQTAFMGTRLGIITPPVTGNTYNLNKENFAKYNKALKDTAELFGVPVLDLTYSCNLKPWESNFRNTFYSADGEGGTGQVDSVHPNSKGHWLIHSKIKEFLKTL